MLFCSALSALLSVLLSVLLSLPCSGHLYGSRRQPSFGLRLRHLRLCLHLIKSEQHKHSSFLLRLPPAYRVSFAASLLPTLYLLHDFAPQQLR